MNANRIVKSYYIATPLFLILEFAFGFDLRVNFFIDDPVWRIVYYLFCFACMGVILWKPGYTIGIGILESGVNLVFLFVGAALRWTFPFTWITEDGDEIAWLEDPVTVMDVMNFVLVGTILILCFHRWVALARRSSRSPWFRLLTGGDFDNGSGPVERTAGKTRSTDYESDSFR